MQVKTFLMFAFGVVCGVFVMGFVSAGWAGFLASAAAGLVIGIVTGIGTGVLVMASGLNRDRFLIAKHRVLVVMHRDKVELQRIMVAAGKGKGLDSDQAAVVGELNKELNLGSLMLGSIQQEKASNLMRELREKLEELPDCRDNEPLWETLIENKRKELEELKPEIKPLFTPHLFMAPVDYFQKIGVKS